MKLNQLPMDCAIVLQQINDDGGDCFADLADTMSVDSSRLAHIIGSLQHKGLITIERAGYETWLTVSSKGRRLMQRIWPESRVRYGF